MISFSRLLSSSCCNDCMDNIHMNVYEKVLEFSRKIKEDYSIN